MKSVRKKIAADVANILEDITFLNRISNLENGPFSLYITNFGQIGSQICPSFRNVNTVNNNILKSALKSLHVQKL